MKKYTYLNYMFLLFYAKAFALLGTLVTTTLVTFAAIDLFTKEWGYPSFTILILLPSYLLYFGLWKLSSHFTPILKSKYEAIKKSR